MKRLKKWYARNFRVLTREEAKEFGLKWHQNIYGDSINHFGCRSFWLDENGNSYRVHSLCLEEERKREKQLQQSHKEG